ncbi:hypothetical protein MPLB_690029 [Mesorhizobium sp. ORS 3324]|nr:hypothetical protein MPLB_690029 [Mesorhizobium sp. ORS 3324]
MAGPAPAISEASPRAVLIAPHSFPPPSVLPDISPARGRSDVIAAFAIVDIEGKARRPSCHLPPCGGDGGQARGGCCPASGSDFCPKGFQRRRP